MIHVPPAPVQNFSLSAARQMVQDWFRVRPWYIAYYLSWSLIVPVLVAVRFMLLTPIAWVSPAARRRIHQHASSMVIDPSYIRPLPTASVRRTIRLQKFGCLLWCWAIALVPPIFLGHWPLPFLVHAYLTALVVIFLNSVRTLGSHRWRNEGDEMTFLAQRVDSVNYPQSAWTSELWAPVGCRYHALHHLFPLMPYDELPRAHQRLMQQLPADSPYRLTNSPSLLTTLRTLWRETTATAREIRPTMMERPRVPAALADRYGQRAFRADQRGVVPAKSSNAPR